MARANLNPTTLKFRVRTDPDHPGRGIITGPGTKLKQGEIGVLNSWIVRHMEQAGIAEVIEEKR